MKLCHPSAIGQWFRFWLSEWNIGVVTYEAMISQGGRSVIQVLVVRVDIGVVIYEAMTPHCGRVWFRSWLSIGHRSGDL